MRRTRGLKLLCLGQCLQLAGLSLSMPYMALYLNRERGLGMGTVGLFLALTMLATAFGQAAGGALSDRAGRRPVMVGSLVGRAVLTFLLAAAVHGHWSVPAVVASHMAGAFAGNLYFPAAHAWIAERWGRHERLEAFGWLRVAANLGWAIGPAVGGFFMAASYGAMFAASAAVCLLTALFVRTAMEADAPVPHPCVPMGACGPSKGAWHGGTQGLELVLGAFSGPLDRRFVRFCGWTVLMGTVMSQLVAPLSVYAVTYAAVPADKVGWLFTINGGLVVLLQPFVNRLGRTMRISQVMTVGGLFYAAGYALVGTAAGFGGLALAMAVITLGETFVSPGNSTLSANLAAPGEAGRYTGLNGFSHQIGSALGPLLGGVMLERLAPSHPALPWLAVAGLALAGATGYRALGRRLTDEEDGFHRAALEAEPVAEAA
ncbi:MFS transporter [bacterium]|nr:MAG: MFS transporter [bacterium]